MVEEQKLSLTRKVLSLSKVNVSSFHALPVSKKREGEIPKVLLDLVGERFLQSEITYDWIDNLVFPKKALKQSECDAAKIFGVDRTMYITSGTTVANQIALLSLLKRKDRVLVDRTCHQSIHLKIITDKSTENNMKEFFPKIRSNIVSFSFTSGTTNTPKCIYRTGSFDKRRLPKLTELYQFGDKDKFLVTMPFYHVSVIGWVKLTLVNGGTVVFSDFDSSNDMVSKITSHKITTTLMTPPTLEKVVDRIELSNFYNDSIRFIMVGGKNFPVLLKLRALKIFGNVINEYYGSSETGINTLSNSNDIRKYPESSGRVMDGSTVYIVDDRNNLKNIGEIGRIAIHSYQNATGYLNRDMEKAIINDKLCILTADYGYINSEGYIFIVQRKIFNSEYQSKNLFSLENRLRLVRYVDDVSIFQKEDGEYEVVLSCKDISPLEIKVLDDFVKIIVQPYFSNYSLRYVENISYSMSGKVKYSTYLGG